MITLKLLANGMTDYTGFLGEIEFKDGVTVKGLSKLSADRIAAVYRSESVGEEDYQSATEALIDGSAKAEVKEPLKRVTEEDLEAQKIEAAKKVIPTEAPPFDKIYTVEELNAIASKKGISGLRAIAAPAGVKNTSIGGLIREMLDFQKAKGFAPEDTLEKTPE